MRRWMVSAAIAAGLAVVAVGIWQMRPDVLDAPGPGHLRSTSSAQSWHVQVETDADGWTVTWRDQPGGGDYTVRVQSATGAAMWEAKSASSPLRVPRQDVAPLPGETYFVSVHHLHDGREETSPAVTLPAPP